MGHGTFLQDARVGSKPHGTSHVGHIPLIREQIDDRVWCVLVEFGTVRPFQVRYGPGELHDSQLHPQAGAEVGNFLFPRIPCCPDLPLRAAVPEPAGNQDPVGIAKQGMPLSTRYLAEIRSVADRHGLLVHLDGARLFNAAVALGVEASEITRNVDSVSFCLSKGLCAPVGSLVCGSSAFISEARRIRKALGGGMRQAGILAAAGIVALEQMIDRLAEDHENARCLALGLAAIPGIELNPEEIQTNIVFFELSDDVPWAADEIASKLKEEARVFVSVTGARAFRAVTHYWVGSNEVEILLGQLQTALAN